MIPRVRTLLLVAGLVVPTLAAAQGTRSDPETEAAARAALEARAGARPDISTPSPSERALLPGPVDAASYRLGPGDGLSLELTGRADRQRVLVVDAEGRLAVPELGVVAVGGRTLEDVRTQVIGRLKSVYSGVRIDLRLVSVRSFKVYVAGQVQSPGVAVATAATRASELLTGPLTLLPEASRRNLELRRRDGQRLRVDVDAFAYLGHTTGNPYLEDGDVLVVPTRSQVVFANGAFGRPGEYELAPGDRVSDLVELAGGLIPGADTTSGRLMRFVSATVLDSMVVRLTPGGPGDDPTLEHQDRVYARRLAEFRQARNVTVQGEVLFPGPYAVREGEDRLSAVIARAGGLTAQAAGDRILVFRPSAPAGQQDIEFERLSRLSRTEMTDAEYQTFKTKLASQQAAYIVSVEDLARGTGDFDVLLRDNDVILVDRAMPAVRVAGEVQRPSLLEYRAGRSGRDYIELAGGYTQRGDGDRVRLTRAGSNQTIYLSEAKEIRPGDFIWVPERKDVNFWGVFKDTLLVAGSIATIIILLRDQ